jgi:hypothetical protein
MGDWCGNYLNPGKCVGDDVVLARYVADVRSKLRDEIQMVELAWGALVPLLVEGEDERLVVCENGKMSGLQHVPKVPHGLIYHQELRRMHCTSSVLDSASWRRRVAVRRLVPVVLGRHPWWWLKRP